MVDDKGGATKQLKAPDAHKETVLEHVLDSIAGMIGEWAPEVIAELKEHIRDVNWFFGESDSHHIALGISYLDGDPEVWLCGFIEVTHRLLVKFSRPHREATKLLQQKDVLDAVMIYNLFEKWDAMYFQGDDRPKSDLVVRCFFRVFGRRASRKVFYGWDLKPLPPDWRPEPKLTFDDWLRIASKKPAKDAKRQDKLTK